MPQSRLPDINTAFNFWRGKAVMYHAAENYTEAVGALYAFNGLLPDSYRVTISTSAYNEKTKDSFITKCKNCDNVIDFKTVKVYELLLPLISNIITNSETEKVWDCPSCHKTNRLAQTKVVQQKLQSNSLLKTVPEPPRLKDGIADRSAFQRKFAVWFLTFIGELEAQAAQYRDDNWQKGEKFFDDSGIDTTGEDEE